MAEEEDSTRKNSSSSTQTGSGNTKEAHHRRHQDGNGNDDDDDDASGWLRLGIGCSAPHHNQTHNHNNKHSDQPGPRGSMQLELNLLPAGSRTTTSSLLFQQQQSSVTRATAFLPPPPLFYYQPPQQQQQIMSGWANNNCNISSNYYRMMTPVIPNYAINPTTSVMVVGSPSTTQPAPAAPSFLLQPRPMTTSFQLPQSSADHIIRLIDPPRRPHSGIWFLLQPSLHQSKQPFLPQLPKNYLRIKDGRMTVRFLIKYLVNKLGLESESEVEIRCRGQQLEASLTMQHVRDEIWSTSTREAAAASSAAHHLMLLHYARSS